MNPTIGRIVHFFPNDQARQRLASAGGNPVRVFEPLAALVVQAWGPTPTSAVNLLVFPDGPTPVWFTSVPGTADVPTSKAEGNTFWAWPERVG